MDVALCSPPAILNLSFITVLTFYLRPGPPLPRLLIWRNEKHKLQYWATPTTDLVLLTSLYSWAGELVTPVNLETQRQPNENTMVHMLTLTSRIYVLLLTTVSTDTGPVWTVWLSDRRRAHHITWWEKEEPWGESRKKTFGLSWNQFSLSCDYSIIRERSK